jgi:crossover junction endodeoxyribonuclease RuvC
MRILGIDPGYGRMGWGVIEGNKNGWKLVASGCLETKASTPFLKRLQELRNCLQHVIETYKPDKAGVEQLFFAKNAKTAMDVGQARGVILVTLFDAGLPITEATPMQVKQSVVGYGKADKLQIQHMVALQLGLKNKKMQDDMADALAIALTVGYVTR